MDIKVVIATHRQYEMPADEMYIPVQVGKAINKVKLPYLGDNNGKNISWKNANYCELTAMYWAWKNLKANYIGLAHYRRHFCIDPWYLGLAKKKRDHVMTSYKSMKLLANYDAILPKKRHYWIETLMSHYEHTHQIKDLKETRRVIESFYPSYLNSFDKVMQRTSAHMFNMFIMRYDLFDAYCTWLFDVLKHLEDRIDISNYSPSEARVFGYISELLLDVWLDKNPINYTEMPVMFMEKQNWFKKIAKFIKNKYLPHNKMTDSQVHEKNDKVSVVKVR